jgi:transposase
MESEAHAPSRARRQRRRYAPAFKRALVEQTLAPGASVSLIARAHDINTNQLFKWRRQHLRAERKVGVDQAMGEPSPALIPVTIVAEACATDAVSHGQAVAGDIEIQLTAGCIRVRGAPDAATLRVILASLRR